MPWNASISAGSATGSFTLWASQRRFLRAYGTTLEEMRLALVEAAKTVCAEGLHDADVDVGVVVLHECGAIDRDECSEAVEVMIQKFLAQRGRQVSLSVVEKGSDVVLQCAFAAALVVQEVRFARSRSITLRDWKSR